MRAGDTFDHRRSFRTPSTRNGTGPLTADTTRQCVRSSSPASKKKKSHQTGCVQCVMECFTFGPRAGNNYTAITLTARTFDGPVISQSNRSEPTQRAPTRAVRTNSWREIYFFSLLSPLPLFTAFTLGCTTQIEIILLSGGRPFKARLIKTVNTHAHTRVYLHTL